MLHRLVVAVDGDAARILAKRTLTTLNHSPPARLQHTHSDLDEAVFAAYGWDRSMTDEEILEGLLSLDLERAAVNPITIEDDHEEEGR